MLLLSCAPSNNGMRLMRIMWTFINMQVTWIFISPPPPFVFNFLKLWIIFPSFYYIYFSFFGSVLFQVIFPFDFTYTCPPRISLWKNCKYTAKFRGREWHWSFSLISSNAFLILWEPPSSMPTSSFRPAIIFLFSKFIIILYIL